VKSWVLVLMLAACGRHAAHPVEPAAANDITLYRDVALVRQRVEVAVPAGTSSVTAHVAAAVTGDRLLVLDRGGLDVRAVHVAGPAVPIVTPVATPPVAEDSDDATADSGETPGDDSHLDENPDAPAEPPPIAPPTDVVLDVAAPHAGTYAIVLAYTTNRLQWDADYTMTTTPARDGAVLRGAIAVRNTTGIAFTAAAVHVIDADLGGWRTRTAEHLATALVGGTPSTTPAATPRDLGVASLVAGETRVEIAGISAPRAMHSVLVYDPIGTKLDNASAVPVRDDKLGIDPAAPARITESFEVQRDERTAAGLPAGPVRLLERRADGGLGVLGESRLFDAATRVADVDTIAVGTAEGVVGHRERRELTIDDARQRLTEEFVITLDNTRDHEVGVLVREHLYRGQNWNVAFESTKRPAKEGAQQFSMRSTVPAKSQQKILYVVVYTWPAPQ
jgi:hypothetical protein